MKKDHPKLRVAAFQTVMRIQRHAWILFVMILAEAVHHGFVALAIFAAVNLVSIVALRVNNALAQREHERECAKFKARVTARMDQIDAHRRDQGGA